MLINEVCKATGLTKKAIEYYQRKGIVNPVIDTNGYREFSQDDIDLLKQVSMFRSLGMQVSEIKTILDSNLQKEELRKCILKKRLENELVKNQIKLLKKFSKGESIELIKDEIGELDKRKSIKEKLLEVFPGFYGRFYLNHFNKFLEEPIQTKEQKEAYQTVVNFLDQVNPPNISEELMKYFEEAMDFWTDERIAEVEEQKQLNLNNLEAFFENYSEILEQYQAFKESDEYRLSPFGQLMESMKAFGEVSGYNNIFIPAMRKLSPTYDRYYQQLLEANKLFIEKFPNFK